MSIKSKMTSLGVPAPTTQTIVGTVTSSLTAAGAAQSTALSIFDDINICTTVAASTGVLLRADLSIGDTMIVANYGANSLSVYPPGTGKINNGSASAALALGVNKVGKYIVIDGGTNTNYLAIISA
jgi:hypothetical protein